MFIDLRKEKRRTRRHQPSRACHQATASWVRFLQSVFCSAELMRLRTVPSLMNAAAAISWLSSPSAMRRTTSYSRSVSWEKAARQRSSRTAGTEGGAASQSGRGGTRWAASRLAFYLTFSSYTVTSSVIVVAGVVLSTLNAPDVRRRHLASPVNTWRMRASSIAGCAVLTLGACA